MDGIYKKQSMNKIDKQIEKIKNENRIGLMTHVVVGYPSIDETEKIIETLIKAGSDFIEMQIPFSDPIADGTTIMAASEQAIRNRSNVNKAFEMMQKVSKNTSIPLLFMSYYNIIFNYGVEKFCKKASQVGASGLIIPDIPPEEERYEKYLSYALKYNLYPIRVISPASSEARLKINAKVGKGFVYCISRYGITGANSSLDPKLGNYLKKIKNYFKIPLAVGFGISKKEHVRMLKSSADIAVVGSAVIDFINKKSRENKNYYKDLENFVKDLITL